MFEKNKGVECLENRDIICVSSVDWEPLWTRKQQIMSRLPKSNRILYVEPPISFLSTFKDPSLAFKKKRAREGVRQATDNIWVLSLPVVLPFGSRFPYINMINQKMIADAVNNAVMELGFTNTLLWTYLHTSCDLISRIQHDLLIYDCVDEHAAYQGFNADLVRKMEKQLIKECDIVFCTARGLYDDKKKYAKEIWLSPNAADIAHFIQAADTDYPIAEDIAKLPCPRLGFVGAIKEWIDLELLEQTALSFPEGSLLMVGPVGAGIDVSGLNNLPNVHLLGHRDRQLLPRYLRGFDVCLNPFRLSELTETVSPLKFYEYLASGKPIASVPMPEIESFSDVIEFGSGSQGFVQACRNALMDTEEKRDIRLKRAQENSWESRAAFMMEKINVHLK